ncbi:deoxyguanosinetriphosphate triphosphohydrolase [Sporohalobacter salinus]|uniref:deoxyguanosinetriphosphate triphosphohydrolase n=1 Tax=Sporohalobacter salinus TaxID=1494606 RepID=UPI00195FE27A|nr:deoxyguanosinetriphosphate triphosphohydrolase [Sporohalobacter salinus]MBM7623194.1 dGTPase [Sporohalobacter salinus]
MDSHRKRLEELECKNLVQYATLSKETEGRNYPDTKCEIRTEFQRDRDRIIHSKAFRRLKHKTQVFIAPEGDHYRTRLTHTLEVAQIAHTIAKALHLNADLTEAISLGHDLGHTPFGHSGEEALAEMYSEGFKHNQQSLRVVELLEDKSDDYPGLNLTFEVRDGILTHTDDQKPKTLEGEIVRIADRIAYINHDIDDALRAQIIAPSDLPETALKVLGCTSSERIDRMVKDIIKHSWQQAEINRSQQVKEATDELREFLYNTVYVGSKAKKEEDKAKKLLQQLYNYYNNNPEKLPQEFKNRFEMYSLPRIVVDYIAGMSDRYALKRGGEIFLPRPWLG